MENAYKYLAWVIALAVLLQAAAIGYYAFGFQKYLEDDQALRGSLEDAHFSGVGGMLFHGVLGTMVFPVLGIALLVVAVLSKIPGATRTAAIMLALIVVEVGLGQAAHAVPLLGMVHGILALAVFGYAAMIGVRAMLAARRPRTQPA